MTTTISAEERRANERQRIDAACRELLDLEGWKRWLRARSLFHSYSFRNQLLIAMQRPDATRVAGFQAWRRLGRQVRKGERSIRVLAPIRIAQQLEPESQDPSNDGEPKRVAGYRSVGVFDITQTDAIPGIDPLPLEPPAQPISGDSHAHLLPALEAHAASLGYRVSYPQTRDCDGYCDHSEKLIAVSKALPPNAQVRVLIHELCHAHGADYKTYERAACEVIVDAATHITCASVGLDVAGDTIPYISGWGGADDAVAAVTRFAETIDALAATIEGALARASA